MDNFVSVITITFPSFIAYEEWFKRTKEFFLNDEKIKTYLIQSGLKKWTIIKTDDKEPVKAIVYFEYEDKNSFEKCQKIFLKFMPKLSDLIYKSNIVRGNVIFDEV